jgi:hypothetical protein
VNWLVLYYGDVTEENLEHVIRDMTAIKYVYWCGHANSHVGRDEHNHIPGVQRTERI